MGSCAYLYLYFSTVCQNTHNNLGVQGQPVLHIKIQATWATEWHHDKINILNTFNFQLLLMNILFVLIKEFFIFYGFILHSTSFYPTLSHERSSWDIFPSSGDAHINYSTLDIWRINILLWSDHMSFGKIMSIVSVINIKYQTGRTGFSSFWLEIHEVCSPDVSFRDLLPVSPSLEMLISNQECCLVLILGTSHILVLQQLEISSCRLQTFCISVIRFR